MTEAIAANMKVLANLLLDPETPRIYQHIKLSDLSDEAQEWVGSKVTEALNERDRRGLSADDNIIYLAVLEAMGIDCPHSRRQWYVGGAWECKICGCYFMPLKRTEMSDKPKPGCPGTYRDRDTGEYICLADGGVCNYESLDDECPRPSRVVNVNPAMNPTTAGRTDPSRYDSRRGGS